MSPATPEISGPLDVAVPMVKKLSNSIAGNALKNAGCNPLAFQPALSPLLYHVPEVELTIKGLSASPPQADKKSVSLTQFRYTR
jgi:hypothetical protein